MIDCVLWDFGDTLADERFLMAPLAGFPDWPSVVRQQIFDGALGQEWFVGKANMDDVVRQLSTILGADAATIHDHMIGCCRRISFFERPMDAARSSHLAQAIVTINSDIFSDHVVPNYRLDRHFNPIVTSWQDASLDKSDLCDSAMRRLGLADRGRALLIDNKADNVAGWRARGGIAYHLTGNTAFSNAPPEPFS